MYARQFRSVCETTSIFQTKQYLLALSTQFLCLVDSKISETQAQGLSIELSPQDLIRFRKFQKSETQLKAAIKLFRKRGGNLENEMGDWEIWFLKNILSIECDILIKKSNYTHFILLFFALGLSRRSDVLFF